MWPEGFRIQLQSWYETMLCARCVTLAECHKTCVVSYQEFLCVVPRRGRPRVAWLAQVVGDDLLTPSVPGLFSPEQQHVNIWMVRPRALLFFVQDRTYLFKQEDLLF